MINYRLYRLTRILEAVRLKFSADLKGKKWLDLGCHDGTLARLLAEQGICVTGIDVYSPSLKTEKTWDYVQHDLDTGIIPLPDQAFEIVSGIEIIEHVTDTDMFLNEISRVLKPGGVLVLSTPNICMLKNRFRMPLGKYPYGIEYRNALHHVRLYNLRCLADHLREHGFRVVLSQGEKLLPQKMVELNCCLRKISEFLAFLFPSLCANLVVVCVKN